MTETLGKYVLRRILGKGAMGTVYEGYDPVIDRVVAIKTVRLVDADSEDVQAVEELERFRREAKAAGRLQHPNIVGVFDYGETADMAYIVMEYVDGTTLRQALDSGERYGINEVVRLMDALLAGLQFSHDRGVVHRDIKPANVMLTTAGEIKIADFGIARIESSSFTQAGTILGTPAYMSPEQFMGQRVDARTDIYSTGVMLYQILTGEKPFDGGLTAIMHKVLNSEPLPPSALSISVTPAMDAVVLTAMAKQPAQRHASASAFATALRDALQAEPPASPAATPIPAAQDDDGTLIASAARSATTHSAPSTPAPAEAAPPKPQSRRGPPLAALAAGGVIALAVLGGGGYFLFGPKAHDAGQLPPVASLPGTDAAEGAATQQASPPQTNTAQTSAAQMGTAQTDHPAMLRANPARIAAALGTLPCTFVNVAMEGEQAVLSGYVGAGTPRAAFDAAVAQLSDRMALRSMVQSVEGPYCPVFEALRPYHAMTAPPTMHMAQAGGAHMVHDGEPIALTVSLPAYAARLWTVYFSNDGTAVRIYPGTITGNPTLPANATRTLGDGGMGGARMQAGAPFGTDLAVSVAVSAPSATGALPAEGSVTSMVTAMTGLLSAAGQAGGQVAIALHPVVTRPAGQ
ncbi:putative serine/threonine protein kinase [Komagataeibacter intermedius AF2]|uniref:non-specific serine/threonine protein kinase n=1 Tax=Komagataeibacter intermedius AF2 TaxID=1458464 RepID=A0A0N1N6E0_9PROT|nr:serine/threonine-protein kinase [Komagataeibacter intermedius]KPH86582.1 putative serine/threonine protein kinase [Komagataeibacter intermedius AF2]